MNKFSSTHRPTLSGDPIVTYLNVDAYGMDAQTVTNDKAIQWMRRLYEKEYSNDYLTEDLIASFSPKYKSELCDGNLEQTKYGYEFHLHMEVPDSEMRRTIFRVLFPKMARKRTPRKEKTA